MVLTRVRGADWLAALGGLLMLVSLFLPWYAFTDLGVSGWEALSVIDLVLAVVAVGAILLPLVTAARDAVPVPLVVNVLTALLSVIATLLVVIRVIWTPADGLDRDWGLWLALVAVLLTTVAAWRALADERSPAVKPPPPTEHQPTPPAQAAPSA